MNPRLISFLVCLTCSAGAEAIQPVEAGLWPLHERITAITDEQLSLNQKLLATETSAQERASSYRRYKVLEEEKKQIAGYIARANAFAKSPLVTFMSPVTDAR